jgi:hypothetical protein
MLDQFSESCFLWFFSNSINNLFSQTIPLFYVALKVKRLLIKQYYSKMQAVFLPLYLLQHQAIPPPIIPSIHHHFLGLGTSLPRIKTKGDWLMIHENAAYKPRRNLWCNVDNLHYRLSFDRIIKTLNSQKETFKSSKIPKVD